MALENNLRAWREGKELSREYVAEKTGTTAVSIFRIEKGQQQPRPALLEKLAKLFEKEPSDFYNVQPAATSTTLGTRRIPILDFVQAGDFTTIGPNPDSDEEDFILTTLDPSPKSFGLRIRGRSMEPEFSVGDIVVFDPEIYPRAEDFVVAINESGKGTFKRFHDVGLNENNQQVFELVSLNPAYPTWRSDRMRIDIRGTMIEHRRFRRGAS